MGEIHDRDGRILLLWAAVNEVSAANSISPASMA
jgi:hypothetical protein